jgi:hypothetical protein
MRLVSFNFNKISIEKFKNNSENIKFNTKIEISSIDSLKADVFKFKEDLIKIDFTYTVLYEPEFAKLDFAGTFILSVDSKTAREILSSWKDKKTSEEFRKIIFNIILKKANIKALQLEDELGLPIHIHLPTFKQIEEKDNNSQ